MSNNETLKRYIRRQKRKRLSPESQDFANINLQLPDKFSLEAILTDSSPHIGDGRVLIFGRNNCLRHLATSQVWHMTHDTWHMAHGTKHFCATLRHSCTTWFVSNIVRLYLASWKDGRYVHRDVAGGVKLMSRFRTQSDTANHCHGLRKRGHKCREEYTWCQRYYRLFGVIWTCSVSLSLSSMHSCVFATTISTILWFEDENGNMGSIPVPTAVILGNFLASKTELHSLLIGTF